MFAVTTDPIDVSALARAVADRRAGAVVTFVGMTRNHNVGRKVLRLEYEAYERMAKREMRRLATEASERWPLCRASMVHRVGVVPVGEASVAIAVSSGHRTEAFEACRWLIDRLKEIVPIWKKEHYRGGKIWIGPQQGGPSSRRTRKPPARRKQR